MLPGADGVVSMLMAQPLEVFRHDLEICGKYDVSINVGDTRNAAGIFRFLRTVPPMLDILHDIKRYCPQAIFLNYTNPMAMLCRAMQEAEPEVVTTGLCHSVQGGIDKFGQILGIPYREIDYLCAGINHMAYYLSLRHNGRDLYCTRAAPAHAGRPSRIQRGHRPQRGFPRLRLLCNRVQRPLLRVLPVVQKTQGSAGEVLLSGHQLEHRPREFHHRAA